MLYKKKKKLLVATNTDTTFASWIANARRQISRRLIPLISQSMHATNGPMGEVTYWPAFGNTRKNVPKLVQLFHDA